MKKFTAISFINRIYSLLAIAAITFLASCSKVTLQDGNMDETPKPSSPYAVSYNEAMAELESLLADIDTPTKGKSPRKVANYYTTPISGAKTKSNADTPFIYVFNFENNEGFAILSGDKRTTPVFAITESGNYNQGDSIDNPGFKLFMSRIGDDYWNDYIDKENGGGGGGGQAVKFENGPWSQNRTGNVIASKWGQGYPYNKYCPYGYPAGCVATAMAQIMYYHGHPAQYGSYYNWTEMRKHTGIAYGQVNYEPAHDMIAYLMFYLGASNNLDMNYAPLESGALMSNISRTFANFGYSSPGKSFMYYDPLITSEIQAGRPVIVGGRSNTSGHAWIIDGFMNRTRIVTKYKYFNGWQYDSQTTETEFLVHCNWGWNEFSDGYFYSKVFDINKGPIDLNTTKSIENDLNFSNGLKIIYNISK